LPDQDRQERTLVLVYSTTIFLNAALLFIIEPMVAKMILPFLGGSPAVWNTSLMFYQACLLAGYAYTHFGASWLGTRRHACLHLLLAVGALSLLPVALPMQWLTAPTLNPVSLVLGVLAVSIGFPFLVLSAGAPLMQKWFAQGRHNAARDPYFLYAASNAGSMAGLLAYPLLLEPRLTLSEQNYLWFYGYVSLLILMSLCAWYFFRSLPASNVDVSAVVPDANFLSSGSANVTFSQRLRWVVWSLVPSSLLLGVTSYATTDVASAPLLWVVPLTAYLLSFVVVFAHPPWAGNGLLVRLQALLLIGAASTIFLSATQPAWFILPLHLIAFFVTSLVCHGQLAMDRPDTRHLTEFYLWISVGGVLGGMFNALIAPVIFTSVIEYPLAIAAAAFLRPRMGESSDTRLSSCLDWLLPPALVALIFIVARVLSDVQIVPETNERLLVCGVSASAFMAFIHRPRRFGVAVMVLVLLTFWYPSAAGKILYADRSFFGSYRVTLHTDGKRHVLFQGTTVHGAQNTRPESRRQPIGYYHATGPAGQVLSVTAKLRGQEQIAIIGLGTGALACHGSVGQTFTFYEIDPMVEKIARDERLFTYLRECPPTTTVVIGDARLSLSKVADQSYDLLVLDAFSSDVIPTHLLTREALQLYLKKIASDGVLLAHISNRYMDLAPVLTRLAQSLNLGAYIQNDFDIAPGESAEGKSASRWMLLARRQSDLSPFVANQRWQIMGEAGDSELWTDDFTDLLKVIHWR
jgi:hypothetical protein